MFSAFGPCLAVSLLRGGGHSGGSGAGGAGGEAAVIGVIGALISLLIAVIAKAGGIDSSRLGHDPKKWYGAMVCRACGYPWQSRKTTPPARCPKCHSNKIAIQRG
jgi:DNA-directed RNA polymerase subunit RPC12/RpoP